MKHTSTTDTTLKGVPFLRTDYCGTVQGSESSVATVGMEWNKLNPTGMIREQKNTPDMIQHGEAYAVLTRLNETLD